MTKATEPRRAGLHCVYGQCRMSELGMCSPACSFTMNVVDPTEALLRQLMKDAPDAAA